ncbi:MAG: hypothetical protein ACRCUJ_13010 [Phocaeicola sp.]
MRNYNVLSYYYPTLQILYQPAYYKKRHGAIDTIGLAAFIISYQPADYKKRHGATLL